MYGEVWLWVSLEAERTEVPVACTESIGSSCVGSYGVVGLRLFAFAGWVLPG